MNNDASPAVTTISLGWGIQSWTLAAMSALGDLPPVTFAIHADTTWEREATYAFAAEATPWLEARGVRVITVSDPNQTAKATTDKTDMPAYTQSTVNAFGGVDLPVYTTSSNGQGRLRRQCTHRWKIGPIRAYLRQHLKENNLTMRAGIIETWLGITLDEWQRAKDSDVRYIRHRYPLLEKNFSRADCVGYLQKHDLPVPIKSSCVFCPFHSNQAWRDMKQASGPDWQQAVDVDRAIRHQRPPHALYVHRANLPLEEAVRIPEDQGQEQLAFAFEDQECDSGYCFM